MARSKTRRWMDAECAEPSALADEFFTMACHGPRSGRPSATSTASSDTGGIGSAELLGSDRVRRVRGRRPTTSPSSTPGPCHRPRLRGVVVHSGAVTHYLPDYGTGRAEAAMVSSMVNWRRSVRSP
ncbi:hypothetical protein HBB16_20295 [Pseudonocardia sp. MCCB 268]|nr:hypothetical protein [Pseudonocardia cytotoxica]